MKTLFIVAAHGNETFSIPVFQELEKELPKKKYQYEWIIGNPKAVEKNVRFVDIDMNRNAPGSPSSPNYEERRVAELITIAETYDFVVDIHGALSECGVCTIIPNPTIENILLASQFGCQNNVIWKTKDRQKKGPLTQHIHNPAVGLECGPKHDPNTAASLKQVVSQYLKRQGQLFLSKESKSKWFQVCGKLNEANFPETSTWSDFQSYRINGRSIIPFLTKNTYPDGSFFELERFHFEDFFLKQSLAQ